MTRPLKTTIALTAVAAVGLALTVSPAAARSGPACWKVVINDWYDGKISGKYPLHCYRAALAHLGSDTKGYTSAYDDINRALQQRIAEIAAAKKAKTKTTATKSKTKATKTKATKTKPSKAAPPVASKNDGGNSNSSAPAAGSSPSGPKGGPPPPSSVPPRKHTRTDSHASGNQNQTPAKITPKPSRPVSSQTPSSPPIKGRDVNGAGPVQSAIKKLGPSDATSIPIPLLVLAGLAALLMLVGTASLLAKRAQARRAAAVPVRSTPQQQPR